MPSKRGAASPKAAGQRRPRKSEAELPATKRSRRPSIPEIPPLLSSYAQPKPDGCYFDEQAAQRAVEFVERLRHYQGRWAGQRFLLMEWQRRLIAEVFGWMRPDGTRLYHTCYIQTPRKVGKTSMVAAIAAYLAFEDGESAPQIVFAARDREQASHGYSALRYFVEGDPALKERALIYNSRRHILIADNPGGSIQVLSSDAAKQLGANLHAVVADELAFHKTRELWDALRTATGSREQPLVLAITTPGWDRESVAFELHEKTRRISEAQEIDPTFLGVIYGAPDDADWASEATWLAANPSLGETVSLDYYREQAASALAIPTEQNSFRLLLCGQWVGQQTRLIPMDAWDRCAAPPAPAAKRRAFGGLDLASTTDLAAFVLVVPNDDGTFDVIPRVFSPAGNLRERALRDRSSYEIWAREGYLTTTPGMVIDYERVRAAVHEAAEEYQLMDVSYDRWNSSHLVSQLEADGITMVQLGQGFASMSAPTKELVKLITEGRLRHGGHPVLRWNADCTAASMDPSGNVKPNKARSTGRIDGIVALIMALDGATRRGVEPPSHYDLEHRDPANVCVCGHLKRHHDEFGCKHTVRGPDRRRVPCGCKEKGKVDGERDVRRLSGV